MGGSRQKSPKERSRSREDKKSKKKISKTDKKQKHKKHQKQKKEKVRKYSSSSSNSSKSSYLSSHDSSEEHQNRLRKLREERKLEKQDLQRKRLETKNQIRPIVKLSNLTSILKDVKKQNTQLDSEEVERANEKFKQLDHSERRSKLLSEHLSKQFQQEREEYTMEFQNGEYVKVFKPYQCSLKNCNMRFQFSTELQDHMDYHAADQQKINQLKADQFSQSLFKQQF